MNSIRPRSHWHIIGCGSIGGLWATHLHQAGHPVTLILKDSAAEETFLPVATIKVEREQLMVENHFPAMLAERICADDLAVDRISLLVTTKAYDTLAALQAMSHILRSYSVVVIMQNGMGQHELIRQAFPQLPVITAITSQGAYSKAPFHLVHAGHGDTWLGCLTDQQKSVDRSQAADLLALDIPSFWDEEIATRMWVKLAVNCVINGLTVVHQCRNGEILSTELHSRITLLCREIESVLTAALSISTPFNLSYDVTRIATATSNNISSMRQDVLKGRKTELDYINGYLCAQAKRYDIDVPENRALLQELRQLVPS